MTASTNKRCCACGEVKPTTEFYFQNKAKGTFQSLCKMCNTKYAREWRKANPEAYRRLKRKYRDKKQAELLSQPLIRRVCALAGCEKVFTVDRGHRPREYCGRSHVEKAYRQRRRAS